MKQASSYLNRPWLKHYEKGVPATVTYEKICIPDFLARSVRDFPDNTALIFQGYKMTFRQLQDAVDRFATCLTDFGIKKGDPVAIMLPPPSPASLSIMPL
jgi:long-chain acyl-CoA synthetase